MKGDSLGATLALCFGFVAGVSMTAYLVLSDPEVRTMFRAKANRMNDGRWRGLGAEIARNVVLEMREAFPALLRGES